MESKTVRLGDPPKLRCRLNPFESPVDLQDILLTFDP